MRTRLVMLVAASIVACGGEPASEQASTAGASAAASADGCPLSQEDVARILGKPVRPSPAPVRLMDNCSFQLVEDTDVEIELAIKPANLGEMFFAGMQDRMKTRQGPDARADALTLGDEGWAYGAKSGSEAAVRKGDRIYHASLSSTMNPASPTLKNEMIRLVEAMITSKES